MCGVRRAKKRKKNFQLHSWKAAMEGFENTASWKKNNTLSVSITLGNIFFFSALCSFALRTRTFGAAALSLGSKTVCNNYYTRTLFETIPVHLLKYVYKRVRI